MRHLEEHSLPGREGGANSIPSALFLSTVPSGVRVTSRPLTCQPLVCLLGQFLGYSEHGDAGGRRLTFPAAVLGMVTLQSFHSAVSGQCWLGPLPS